MAPPIDTRLGPGLLKLGAPLVDYGPQISNVSLEPSQDSNDGTPTLGEPDPLPEVTESWVLKGSAIQDFEEAAGFVNYCFDNALSVVAFEWTPNTDAAVVYTGDCLITSLPIGGDVSAQNTSDFEFAVQGVPERTDPGAVPAASSREIAARRSRRRSSIAPEAGTTTRTTRRTKRAPKATTGSGTAPAATDA